MVHYILPYACGLTDECQLDEVAKARCERALKEARKHENVYILLTAGMPEYCHEHGGVPTLAEAATRYLHSRDWPRRRILTRPEGYNTLTETLAAKYRIMEWGNHYKYIPITSWDHAPRTFITNWLVFGRPIKVGVAWIFNIGRLRNALREPFAIIKLFFQFLTLRKAGKFSLNRARL